MRNVETADGLSRQGLDDRRGVLANLTFAFAKLARSGQAPLEQIQLALGHLAAGNVQAE
jgi:hypothetical protein